MKIFVAGGCGYIGSVFVPQCLSGGHSVKVIDNMWFGNTLQEHPNLSVTKKDLFTCTESDIEGHDAFVFLAGISNDPMALFKPSLNFQYNGALPGYLAYVSKLVGIKKFVYASSASVYNFHEDKASPEPCREHDCAQSYSSTPYGTSKLLGEFGVTNLADDNFKYAILRKGTVCGFSPRLRFDLVINTMVKSAITTGVINVNDPNVWRPILDIRDAANAYYLATTQNIKGIYNIAKDNYQIINLAQVVQKILKDIGGINTKINVLNERDHRNYAIDTNLSSSWFQCQYGIEDIVKSLIQNIPKDTNFEADEHYNVKIFKKILTW